MKVAYILESFPVVSTTFILNEISEVKKNNIDVDVFAFIEPREKFVHPKAKLIKDIYYFKSRQYLKIIFFHLFWLLYRPHRYVFTALLALSPQTGLVKLFAVGLPYVHMVYARKPDLLHAHFGRRPADFCLLVKLLTNIPYTFTTHRYDIFDMPARNYWLKTKLAKKHITISEYNKNYLVRNFGVPARDIAVIHCGVDFSRKLPVSGGDGVNRIIATARLVKHKSLDILVKACAELKKQGIEFECLIIGDGPERTALNRLIQDVRLSDSVKLLGNKTQDEVFDLLSKAKVAVLPSKSEGIPVSLMEAMACHVPVIGTNVTGNPELIADGESGYLVEPGNVADLAEKIRRLLLDANRRKRFVEKAFKKVKKDFNLAAETDKLIALWKE